MQPMIVGNDSTYNWRGDRRLAACIVAAALLVLAAASDQSDGFYTFLHIYVSGLALILAIFGWRSGGSWIPLSAAVLAILFNPIRPIEMSREAWTPYDWTAAAWFALIGGWPMFMATLNGAKGRELRNAINGWVILVMLLVILGIPLLVNFGSSNADANNTMNVDENLTTTDMNADDMSPYLNATNSSADMNATNMNATPAADDLNALSKLAATDAANSEAAEDRGQLESDEANLAEIRDRMSAITNSPQPTTENQSDEANTPDTNGE